MRKLVIPALSLLLMAASVSLAYAQANVGVSIGPGGVKGFDLSIGAYFHVPETSVLLVRNRYRVADEELPVVFFLAARAGVAPSVILDLRRGRLGWLDIALRYHLTPDIFFVPVAAEHIGPPYGRAYGNFRRYRERREWRRVVLTDREVVDLVNLRFLSEYHRVPPERVMELRANGKAFVSIHEEFGKRNGRPGKGPETQPGKGNNRGDHRK
jgi:hypothetical protein